jgi:uncharacterized membrane protein YhaH (DUF805 family)
MNYYINALKNYAVFDGRETRKSYWMFILFNLVIVAVLSFIDSFIGGEELNILTTIYGLAVLLPTIGIAVRRLHDTERSGWWLLISFVPLVGAIILIVLLALPTKGTGASVAPTTRAEPAPTKVDTPQTPPAAPPGA